MRAAGDAAGGRAAVVKAWSGIVEVAYGSVILADPTLDADGADRQPDPAAMVRLWEDRCGLLGSRLHVLLPERGHRTRTSIRTMAAFGSIEPRWEHVAEASVPAPSGRLRVYSWLPEEDLAAEINVSAKRLVARIHWTGLERWLSGGSSISTDGIGPVRVRIDLAPGDQTEVRTLRTWHLWAPPVHESGGAGGLRTFRGRIVESRRAGLEPISLQFWSPYPTTAEGSVTSLWREPASDTRWAFGTGPMSHPFLQELTPAEAGALEAQGFPPVRTFARDADGRIWSADIMPLERAPALLLIPPDRWAMLQAIFSPDEIRVVAVPDGWSRITRRPIDGAGFPILVDAPTSDGGDGLYQRWPDGAEIPT
jgi:hypothetical protein